jgi:Type IV secretion system pilin
MVHLIAQNTLDLGTLTPPTDAFAPVQGMVGVDAVGGPIAEFISNFLGFMTGLAGIMFLIYMIFAGLSWVSSGGDKGKVEAARSQMTQAALGLVVVIAAYAIAGVVGRVLGLDILNPIKVIETIIPSGARP